MDLCNKKCGKDRYCAEYANKSGRCDRHEMEGVKYDEDKLDYTIIPKEALDEVVRVLMYGAKKYERDNWYKVQDGKNRYIKAGLRHLFQEANEEGLDESGYSHLAHAAASCLFALALSGRNCMTCGEVDCVCPVS